MSGQFVSYITARTNYFLNELMI